VKQAGNKSQKTNLFLKDPERKADAKALKPKENPRYKRENLATPPQ
jgi:hypothetical protein